MSVIQVAAGIILRDKQVLIARRHAHQHQGERWEFPGGKLEAGESALDALKRELCEEIAIDVVAAESFMTADYAYPDKHVQLHFFKVTRFKRMPVHQENQVMRWVPIVELVDYPFPDANQSVVQAVLAESC